jgi:hypothetical protein
MGTTRHAVRRAAAESPKEAARRLRDAGFRVREPSGRRAWKPLDVPGLDLSRALDEVRGKNGSR